MPNQPSRLNEVINHPLRFLVRVLAGFRANQGFLLSGAVAYYTLLSVIPMFALMLVVLSQVVDPQELLETAAASLELIAPGQSAAITQQIAHFLANWKLVGIVGLAILLFFSSMAFTVLENAMSVIFYHRVAIRRRHFLVSAILPYCYILLLTLGLLTVTTISAALHAAEAQPVSLLGYTWTVEGADTAVVYALGVLGEVLLLTSLYLVMPVGRLALSHALIGGITATILWEATRHFLTWYFSTLSLVNVVYGSLTSAIVILLSVEAAAIIVLLGAQVIAEYERGDDSPDVHPPLQT
jgi:YihY family inner membrane protein